MRLRKAVLLGTCAIALTACGSTQAGPAPTVTVTETVTAASSDQPVPSASPSSPADLSDYVFIACTAATQHAILWGFADDVYFGERITGMARSNTKWYLDVLNEASQMSGEADGLPPGQADIIDRVASDLDEQAKFVSEMHRTDDYYVWYDTWMSVVDDPRDMESLQDLLSVAGLDTCPLYDNAVIFAK